MKHKPAICAEGENGDPKKALQNSPGVNLEKYISSRNSTLKNFSRLGLLISVSLSIVALISVITSKVNIQYNTETPVKGDPGQTKTSLNDANIGDKNKLKGAQSFSNLQHQSTLDLLKYSAAKKYKSETQDQCFCKLNGQVDDCSCSVDTVDYYNNMKLFPRLKSLLAKDYFRYFQYNPNKPCLYWKKSMGGEPPEKCTSPSCGVKPCTHEELPPGLQGEPPMAPENCKNDDPSFNETENDKVDATISDSAKKDIKSWKDHDEKLKGFCEMDDVSNPDCIHVDLTINPERFTGYSGESSRKIWKAIYQENCFRPENSTGISKSDKKTKKISGKNKLSEIFGVPQDRLGELCLEKRAFYRAISGLHASITIHLSSRYPEEKLIKNKASTHKRLFSKIPGNMSPFEASTEDTFLPNLKLFLSRFDPDYTKAQGPFWLKNLYFVYLLELRALQKAASYLENESFYTGNEEEDKDTQIAVKDLLNIVRSFPDHYDESKLFTGRDTSEQLKNEFREHFRNVSKVMDCVACDKCKLWGKLQISGLGTALKILFSDDTSKDEFIKNEMFNESSKFNLNRNEIVSLFNAFGRISTSIQQLEIFREMLREDIS